MQILGNLDGIETGIRQLIRHEPLETKVLEVGGQKLTVPTEAEILRIKANLTAAEDPKTIALTGHGRTEDREATAAAGFDGHLMKPIGADAIIALLAA